MIVVFDTKKCRTIRAQDKDGAWWWVEGECLRCGGCGCEKLECVYFTHEVLNGVRKGKCKRQFEKPYLCAMFPYDPDDPLPEGCGLRWIKE